MTSIFTRLRVSMALFLVLFVCISYSYPLQPSTTEIILPTSTTLPTKTLDIQQKIAFLDLGNEKEDDDSKNELKDLLKSAREAARRERERVLQREIERELDRREKERERKEREARERYREEKHRERERKEKEKEKEHERHQHDNDTTDSAPKGNTYGRHQQTSDNDSDDNGDSSPSKESPTASTTTSPTENTIVTTVVIISTETPTSIYSVSGTNPSKQKGSQSSNHQISDPNSDTTSSSDGQEASSTPSANKPTHHKLVIALSVVGGVAGIALITTLFLVTRMQLNKRKKRQQKQSDEEAGHPNNDPPTNFSNNRSITPPPTARLFAASIDDSNNLQMTRNPFSDPTDDIDNSILPSAPPPAALTMQFDPYADYRRPRPLSLISQTTAEPSAPTAKELDAMYKNPFEDDLTEDDNYYPTPSAPSPLMENPSPQLLTRQQRIRPQNNYNPSQSNYSSSELPPPPAYTPSVAPSAPPLYALPTSSVVALDHESSSSRRHSISSFSMISTTRPLSLRRGSGTVAYINTPFT